MNNWFYDTIRQTRERGCSNIVPTPYSPSLEFVDRCPPPERRARCMCLFYEDGVPVQVTAFGDVEGANALAESLFGKIVSSTHSPVVKNQRLKRSFGHVG